MEISAATCSDTETEHNYSDSGCPRMRRPRVVVSSAADLVKFKQARLYEESKRRSIPVSLEQLRFTSFSDSPNLAACVRSPSKPNENLSKIDSPCTRNQGNDRHDKTCRSNKLLSHRLASRLNRKLHASRSWSSGFNPSSMMRRSTLLKNKKAKHLKSRSLSFDKGVLEPNDLQEMCQQQEDTSLVISNVHISISRNSSMVWKDRGLTKQMSTSSITSIRSRRTGLVNQGDEIGQKVDRKNDVINEQDSGSDSTKDEVEEKPEEKEESLLEAITKTAPFKKLSCRIEVASRDSGHVSDEAATVSSHGLTAHQRSCRTMSLCSDIVINTTPPEFECPNFKPKTSNDSSSFSHGIHSRLKQNTDEVDSSLPLQPVVIEKSGTKRHSSDPVGSSNALNHVTPRIGSILESSVKEQRPSSFHAYESSTINASELPNVQVSDDDSPEKEIIVIPCSDQSSTTGPLSVEDLDIGDLEEDWDERRELVGKWLLETEISYVNGLQAIIQDYMVPLQQPQTPMLLGLSVVKEIFFQIPELHLWHKNFLTQVKERVENWHSMGKIGDLFVASFSENKLMETYSKFINNFMQAKSNIQIAKVQLPMFAKFLETASRESRDKLSLSDLLIKPVQRIPRYVLFIKDLLKQTPQLHPDRQLLSQALEEMTTLVELMNESEQEAHRMDQLREFVSNIEGAPNLIVPKRTLLQHDPVTELRGSVMKKDRSLFIFNDILMCASARRKTASSFRRGSISRFSLAPSDHWTFRYKFLWQAPLTAVTLITDNQKVTARHRNSRASLDRSGARLVQDEATLTKMLEMAKSLGLPHQQLESSIHLLLTDVREQIAVKKEQEQCVYSPAAKIDLSVQTEPNAATHYSFVFINEKARNTWNEQFIESKRIAEENNMIHGSMTSLLSHVAMGPQLTFLYPMTLQLCRFGMQLKCAATGLPVDSNCSNSLWMCRSDVYGGQVCLLHVEPQNKLRLMASITVCSSQIRCIAAIPQVTPKASINAEEYFGSNFSQTEAIAYYHHERFESTSSIGGIDSDSDLVSSECSNSNLLADGKKRRPTSGTFGGSNESIQTLTEASEVEEASMTDRRLVNRISTGTLLADENDGGTLTRKKAMLDRRNSNENDTSQSVPLPRRHFSLIAKRAQLEQDLISSLKDYNRSTSVPAVNYDASTNLQQQKAGSQLSIDTVSSCSYDDVNTPVTTPTAKNMSTSLLDKQFSDHRPHSPLKKFMHMFSPTPQHRSVTPGSTSSSKSDLPYKHNTLSRPRSVSANSIDPIHSHYQRSATLGRDRKQFSPMTLKPAHIKVDSGGKQKTKAGSAQKTQAGSSQMWLGTEDKCIYVFGPGDSLRGKSKNTIHMPASVRCIKYHCENVYVGMENGVLAVFSTNCYGVWLFDYPATIQLVEQDNAPVSCCLPVRSVVWVSCSNAIFAVDASLNVEQIISYDDPDIQVLTMEVTACGVWVALVGSTLLYLYQTSNARLLTTVDCCQPVHTLLTGYDSNLSEEKTTNLAITNLLHSQGTLLIGTSAGVVLALELPTSSAHLNSSLHPIALSHGHKGQVDIMINVYTEAKMNESATGSRKLSRRKSNQKAQSQNSLLVMSCGEGYEDYVSKTTISNIKESVGCLAVWQMSSNNNT